MAERLRIARIGHRADGVADSPQGPLYVSYALPSETVEVEPIAGHPDRRHLLRVDTASPQRIEPVCPHFGVCGGCATQHWAFAPYFAWKRGLVIEALAQAAFDAPVDDIVDAHGDGRRRTVLHARRGGRDLLEVGYAAARAHQIIGIDRCPILVPALQPAISVAWAIAEVLASAKKPLDLQFTLADNGLDTDVRGSGVLDAAATAALARVAAKHRLARLTRHGELIAQQAAPVLRVGKASVELPPGGFLQATAAGEEALARLVLDNLAASKNVADLFCGIGTFALRIAEKARVSAFDSDAAAVRALTRAKASGLKPVVAQARDLFKQPLQAKELAGFDAVVFDPPRQGAQAQCTQIAASKVPRVIAVSCNAATFARDARILVDGGYRLETVTPVDQFRYSPHVEIVARFSR